MSKVFTEHGVEARAFVTADSQNEEAHATAGSFNGSLGSEQLPFGAFDADSFVANASMVSEVYTGPNGSIGAETARMPTAQFASIKSSISDLNGYAPPGGGLTAGILGPAAKSYATNASDWQPGWNRLSDYVAKGVYLSMPCREGMLKGGASVDVEFYFGDNSVYGIGSGLAGSEWRYELGVFVDGILVARTGEFSPRRHTHHIVFSHPCPGRRVVVDVRWRGKYDGAGTNNGYSWVSDSQIKITNTSLWLMNRSR